MSTRSPFTPPSNPGTPVPLVQFTKSDLDHEESGGYQFLNQWVAMVTNALNQGNGSSGRPVIPSGMDMAGGTVTGLGAPQGPSDAISAGHAATTYGAPAIAPELDLGGSSALKGLTAAYVLATQAQQAVANLPTYVSGSDSLMLVGGIIIKWGHSGLITSNPLAVSFTVDFPNNCFVVIPDGDFAGGNVRTINANNFTVSGFDLYSSGTDAGAYWFAIGN